MEEATVRYRTVGDMSCTGGVRSQAATPVERLQLAALVNTEGVGGVAAIEAEDLRVLGRACSDGEQDQPKKHRQDGRKTHFQRDFILLYLSTPYERGGSSCLYCRNNASTSHDAGH